MTDHLKQHGYSRYVLGCRCDICRTATNTRQGIYARATRRAARWVRLEHPGMWDRYLDDEYAAAGIERQPVGRPETPGTKWSTK